MKIPIVREWGSWVVFVSSWLAAVVAGLLTRPWESGRDFLPELVLTILGLTFLINSKNPLTSALRTKGREREHLFWLLLFTMSALALLTPFLINGIKAFPVFSLLVVSYIIFLLCGREHHLFAELNGFALLTLSAPVVYFVITGDVSMKLYAAVLVFFSAGVFKVRLRIRKTLFFRGLMVTYCVAAAAVYYILDVSVILLLPLIENIMSAVLMREEKLRTTGNIELLKSIVFIVFIGFFWQ